MYLEVSPRDQLILQIFQKYRIQSFASVGHFGGFSAHDFNTQSGGALRLPFLDSERRSESIFGIQSAPRFQAIYGVESVPPPLSTHIWHSERPPAFKLYMVLRACPAFNPYLAFRAPPAFKLYFVLKAGKEKG